MKKIITVLSLLAMMLTLPMAASSESAAKALSPDTWGVGLPYVTDRADLLTSAEEAELTAEMERLAKVHACNIYIITVEDYTDYSPADIDMCGVEIRVGYNLGYGSEKDCIVLMLSMAERDYGITCYGSKANRAFTDYGKEKLATDYFLNGFRKNNWYEGFSAYLEGCDDLLTREENDIPLDVTPEETEKKSVLDVVAGVICSLALGFVPALIFCSVKKKQMRSVAVKMQADSYIPDRGVKFNYKADTFMFTTHTKIYSPRQSNGSSHGGGSHGGTTIHSGGHSSSHGKF